MFNRICIAACAAAAVIASAGAALAGTTGTLYGHVVDSAQGSPLSGVKVTAISPSQTASAITNASGVFSFVSLAPDTYAVTAQASGYDVSTLNGVTVQADQTQTITIALAKTIAVLGKVNVRATTDLIRPGTTSDVYSINATGQQAAATLAGAGNLNQAYSAMASVPGVSAVQGQQGWYQPIYIRGGDLDQVGWEFDGIPVNRTYDNAPQTFLANLGQQELQVYTGGTSANADASGIAGYVNQVVKKGRYPSFATLSLGMGGPTFYNKASIEYGSATPDQRFSYYIGTSAVNQNYRYINQNNGVGSGGFFYPINITAFGGPANAFGPGYLYGISGTVDRENIANLHYQIAHKNDANTDDVQLLYMASYLYNQYYSSVNDLGGAAYVDPLVFGPPTFQDGLVYNGALMAAPNSADISPYKYPSTPHALEWNPVTRQLMGQPQIPTDLRESNANNVTLMKLQYQRNISSTSYFRIFGYQLYSNWFIHGPVSAYLPFGGEIADYELPSHTYGTVASYTNQLNDQNLLTVSAYYSTTRIQRYTTNGGFPGSSSNYAVTNDVNASGQCVDAFGNVVSCFGNGNPNRTSLSKLLAGVVPGACPQDAGEPFCAAPGTSWLMTENGYHANFNKLNPVFSAFSINDNWKPSQRTTFNIGARIEQYTNNLTDNTVNGYASRAFWFAAYNREYCFGPGYFQPVQKASPTDTCAADFPNTAPLTAVNFVNQNPANFSHVELQPRLGATFEAGPNDVFRGSAGIYSRPASTREASWNTTQEDLATFLGTNFAAYGQFTPNHDVRPDRSTNYDLSWEHHFANTNVSFKVTPFYRSTQDQVQQMIINALTGLFGSFNTGRQVSSGVEFALHDGSFTQDGFAFQLAYTHTNSRIRFNAFSNGLNVIDNMNEYIQWYNSFTSACAGVPTPTRYNPTSLCGAFGSSNAQPTFGANTNPYYNLRAQPLFDRGGWYTPYDLIPQPFAAGNGYEVPDVANLILNYKRGKWAVSPSFIYSSGSTYGSPLVWEGSIPNPAEPNYGPSFMIPDPYTGKFDGFGDFKQPSRLTINTQFTYDFTPNTKATLLLTSLVDQCSQRGYAWDYANICEYSTLPSSFLPPTGGTLAQAAAGPVQLKYPYAMWLNNNNTGFVGTKIPFQAAVNVDFKI